MWASMTLHLSALAIYTSRRVKKVVEQVFGTVRTTSGPLLSILSSEINCMCQYVKMKPGSPTHKAKLDKDLEKEHSRRRFNMDD